MDWDHTPCALDAELLEEGRGDDGFGAGECVRVEECPSDDADEDDAEAAAEYLGAVSDRGAARHRSKIGNHLRHCHCVGGEFELVRQHCRVEILGTMRPESRCQ